MVSGVVSGSLERKEQLLEAVFGTMRSRQGSDCHVATSPRRDVPRSDVTTSGQQCRSQRMGTSRRHHVATSPRHDVSSKICTSSFKVRMAQKLGHRRRTNGGTGFQSRVTLISRKYLGLVPLFIFFGYFRILERCFLY